MMSKGLAYVEGAESTDWPVAESCYARVFWCFGCLDFCKQLRTCEYQPWHLDHRIRLVPEYYHGYTTWLHDLASLICFLRS